MTIEKDEASDILDVASECIRSLLKISILIRKATPRDRFAKALDGRENPFIDQFDINYVGERYPKLARPGSRWLRERLGRAITKRRQFLRYTREHGTRIAGGSKGREPNNVPSSAALEEDDDIDLSPNAPSAIGTELATVSMATTRPSTKASTLDIARLDSLRDDETADDDARSFVSAGSSFQEGTDGDTRLRLPSLANLRPNSSAEFECRFCLGIQTFKHEWSWRRHAYADLRAYTCTLGKGECDRIFFTDSHSWFEHETTAHRRQWMCILCQKGPFREKDRLEAHARTTHGDVLLDAAQMDMLVRAGQSAVDAIPAGDCPFCDEWAASLKAQAPAPSGVAVEDVVVTVEPRQFRRHVALHMEQLALFAIPRTAGDDGDSDGDSRSSANRRATSSRDSGSVAGDEWPPDPPLHSGGAAHALNSARTLGNSNMEELLMRHGPDDERNDQDEHEAQRTSDTRVPAYRSHRQGPPLTTKGLNKLNRMAEPAVYTPLGSSSSILDTPPTKFPEDGPSSVNPSDKLPPKGILKPPTKKFPEEKYPIRERITPLRGTEVCWTKINVDDEAYSQVFQAGWAPQRDSKQASDQDQDKTVVFEGAPEG